MMSAQPSPSISTASSEKVRTLLLFLLLLLVILTASSGLLQSALHTAQPVVATATAATVAATFYFTKTVSRHSAIHYPYTRLCVYSLDCLSVVCLVVGPLGFVVVFAVLSLHSYY